jgi:hypothetical protein
MAYNKRLAELHEIRIGLISDIKHLLYGIWFENATAKNPELIRLFCNGLVISESMEITEIQYTNSTNEIKIFYKFPNVGENIFEKIIDEDFNHIEDYESSIIGSTLDILLCVTKHIETKSYILNY